MAAVGVALYKYVMNYSPRNPQYVNRDRLVMANGHACLWQYIFMHWTGYSAMTFDQLRSYRSSNIDTLCPGHPQIQNDGAEVTVGALGQGVANAVGLAVATKQLAATYNRPGFEILNHMTWCTVGDACLQEGVALEAIQLAGHWKLDNLAILYDNNAVTAEGSLDMTNSEDVNMKMAACGWKVVDVLDGISNVQGIAEAMMEARSSRNGPTFINVRTIIAYGSSKEGSAKTHGDPLGQDDVAQVKRRFGMNPERELETDWEVYNFFKDTAQRGQELEKNYEQTLADYAHKYPDLAREFQDRLQGKMVDDWQKFIPPKSQFPEDPHSTRKSAEDVLTVLARHLNTLVAATADLRRSADFAWEDYVPFQRPDLKTACEIDGDYSGRYLHCGIREHAMVSISNGLAAWNPGTILPVTSAFFMFYLYAAPGLRMGALQELSAIHLATHDSIATGYDGPASQPIEVAAMFRAMPNLLYIRPCDSEETCGAFQVALGVRKMATMLSLSRHPLTQYSSCTSREGVSKGAYVLMETEDSEVTLIGTGSEMVYAVDARAKLNEQGVKARVVSFPCQRLFELQAPEYRESVMQYRRRKLVVVIEAYAVHGWERYADAGYSMRSFGKSLPENRPIYEYFGFDAEIIAKKVKGLVEEVWLTGVEALRGNFRELNGGPMGSGVELSVTKTL